MEEQKNKCLIGEATEAETAEMKKKYGDVYKVVVGESVCYLRRPERKVLSAMSSIANDNIKASEFLLNNCWISGDESIKTDDSKFLGVVSQLGQIIEVKVASLEKL